MAGARDVTEAAYNQFATFDRNIWEADGVAPFAQVYVNRTPQPSGVPLSIELKEALLNARSPVKIFVTGQKGSGKSMELRHLHDDAEIAERFERIAFVAAERVPSDAKMQELLLGLAAQLAEHAADREYDRQGDWAETVGRSVATWASVLPKVLKAPAPNARDFKVAVKAWIVEVSGSIRDDAELRDRVLKEDPFSVKSLARLVEDLLGPIQHYAGRPVLLTVDDTDKLATPTSAQDIFLRHIELLARLPCPMIVTFPYWLHFEDEWNKVIEQHDSHVLHNVKVVERSKPDTVLPAAFGFFRTMYSKLVDPGATLVDKGALTEAVRLSGGIPREFIRVLRAGLRLASLRKQPALTEALLEHAVVELQRGLIPFTQDRRVRERLMAVRRNKQLDDEEDWKLLDSLLVVELTNHRPWYDVHPLLQSYVDWLIDEEQRRQATAEAAQASRKE
jgi:hypothetical protein